MKKILTVFILISMILAVVPLVSAIPTAQTVRSQASVIDTIDSTQPQTYIIDGRSYDVRLTDIASTGNLNTDWAAFSINGVATPRVYANLLAVPIGTDISVGVVSVRQVTSSIMEATFFLRPSCSVRDNLNVGQTGRYVINGQSLSVGAKELSYAGPVDPAKGVFVLGGTSLIGTGRVLIGEGEGQRLSLASGSPFDFIFTSLQTGTVNSGTICIIDRSQATPVVTPVLPPPRLPVTGRRLVHGISLATGWNLISAPLLSHTATCHPSSIACVPPPFNSGLGGVDIVRDTCNFQQLDKYYFDVSTQQYGQATSLGANYPFPPLGYWVYNPGNVCDVVFDRTTTARFSVDLEQGWNLVSAKEGVTFQHLLRNCQVVSGPYMYIPRFGQFSSPTNTGTGHGYFINVAGPCTMKE